MKNKKNLLLLICLVVVGTAVATLYAQAPNRRGGQNPQVSFEQFMSFRINYLVQTMKLDEKDSIQFVAAYKEMMSEKGNLMRKYRGSGEVYHKMFTGQNIPDSLYTKVVMNNAKLQIEDAQLEMKFLEKLSTFLTPHQLFDYQSGERNARSNMMMQRPHQKK